MIALSQDGRFVLRINAIAVVLLIDCRPHFVANIRIRNNIARV